MLINIKEVNHNQSTMSQGKSMMWKVQRISLTIENKCSGNQETRREENEGNAVNCTRPWVWPINQYTGYKRFGQHKERVCWTLNPGVKSSNIRSKEKKEKVQKEEIEKEAESMTDLLK